MSGPTLREHPNTFCQDVTKWERQAVLSLINEKRPVTLRFLSRLDCFFEPDPKRFRALHENCGLRIDPT